MSDPRRSTRERRGERPRALLAVNLLSVAAALALAGSQLGGHHGAHRGRPPRSSPPPTAPAGTSAVRASVSIRPGAPGAPIPQRFLGLSFELSSLHEIASYGSRGDLVQLLRSLGPGVLRFGGASADTRVAWEEAGRPAPAWASSVVGPADLQALRTLAQQSGWRVLLTLGLVHYEPHTAAREVAAAKAALGPWLAGIEVGNEPDSYASHRFRSAGWGDARYDAQVSSYRRAIAAGTGAVPLAGPGVSGSGAFTRWGNAEVRSQRPLLLTGHHYPLACDETPPPSVRALLSERTRVREGRSLSRYVTLSRATGIPFRIDETNTVSCGGRPGISNTFASALWATSYITQTMAAGAAGINLQGNPANCDGYTPVCSPTSAGLESGALRVQPEWYALLLTRQLVGSRPLRSILSQPRGANLVARMARAPDGALQLMLVDDAPPSRPWAKVRIRVGSAFARANVLALSAPSPTATAGVELGGEAVASDGSWQLPAPSGALPVRGGLLEVSVAPASAELVTIAPPSAQGTSSAQS